MDQNQPPLSKMDIASKLITDINDLFQSHEEGLTTLFELKMQLIDRIVHFADKEF